MSKQQAVAQATKAISEALSKTGDQAVIEGLIHARTLIEKSIPDLEGALSAAISALDDASSVVDKSEDEEYAYQDELEWGRSAIERLEKFNYEDEMPKPPM